ncbi:MAG: F0F1 ATP synthase subunit A [Deltaproteobacteria bacterium]|nr:F0F1 ATP synthase subunit A [Deltaproteobacteria bacterium]
MSAEHSTVFQLIGVPHHLNHIAGAVTAGVILTAIGLRVRSQLSNVDKHILPEPKMNFLNCCVALVGAFKNLIDSMIGHGAEKFIPIIATTFLFILFSNFLGLVPGFVPPTDNINTNFAMGLSIFLYYQYLGFKEHGIFYLKQFTGGLPPKGYSFGITAILSLVAALMFAIEVIGHLIRPLSLSLRLWGNINGDHTLVGVFNGIAPLFVPILFMVLGVFVCVVQAFVFSLLSTAYIKLAVSHDH